MALLQSLILRRPIGTVSALIGGALVSLVFPACGGETKESDDASDGGESGAGHGGTQSGTAGRSGKAGGGSAGTQGGSAGNVASGGSAPRAGNSGDTGNAGTAGSSGSGGGSGTGDGGAAPVAGTGGTGTAAGAGGEGDAGSGNPQGGSAGAPECDPDEVHTLRKHAQRGRSQGYSGTSEDYYDLWDVTCTGTQDCIQPCKDIGGTEEMCSATECSDSEPDYCYPPPYWYLTDSLYTEGTDPYAGGAELVMVYTPYHDYLLFDDFKLEVPENAEIVGITATLRRTADGENVAADRAVRLIKGGVIGEADRASPTPWNMLEFANVDYGGPSDLWNTSFTPADVNAADFGVALALNYQQTNGNGRAYVDIAYVTVSYKGCP